MIQSEIGQVRALMKAGTLSQAVAQAAIVQAEEELRALQQASPAREEKETARILRMLPRAAETLRARLPAGNMGLRDPRSLIARVGINRGVLLQATASAAGSCESGSGGRI
jgi:hypothetical protein